MTKNQILDKVHVFDVQSFVRELQACEGAATASDKLKSLFYGTLPNEFRNEDGSIRSDIHKTVRELLSLNFPISQPGYDNVQSLYDNLDKLPGATNFLQSLAAIRSMGYEGGYRQGVTRYSTEYFHKREFGEAIAVELGAKDADCSEINARKPENAGYVVEAILKNGKRAAVKVIKGKMNDDEFKAEIVKQLRHLLTKDDDVKVPEGVIGEMIKEKFGNTVGLKAAVIAVDYFQKIAENYLPNSGNICKISGHAGNAYSQGNRPKLKLNVTFETFPEVMFSIDVFVDKEDAVVARNIKNQLPESVERMKKLYAEYKAVEAIRQEVCTRQLRYISRDEYNQIFQNLSKLNKAPRWGDMKLVGVYMAAILDEFRTRGIDVLRLFVEDAGKVAAEFIYTDGLPKRTSRYDAFDISIQKIFHDDGFRGLLNPDNIKYSSERNENAVVIYQKPYTPYKPVPQQVIQPQQQANPQRQIAPKQAAPQQDITAVGRILNQKRELVGLVLSDGKQKVNSTKAKCIELADKGKIKNVKAVHREGIKPYLQGNGVSLEALPVVAVQ